MFLLHVNKFFINSFYVLYNFASHFVSLCAAYNLRRFRFCESAVSWMNARHDICRNLCCRYRAPANIPKKAFSQYNFLRCHLTVKTMAVRLRGGITRFSNATPQCRLISRQPDAIRGNFPDDNTYS